MLCRSVETVDAFTNQQLKANFGSDRWKRFFLLMSAVLAIRERTAPVAGVPSDWGELTAELQAVATELNARELLDGLRVAVDYIGRTRPRDAKLFLLELDTREMALRATPYPHALERKATDDYLKVEKRIANDPSKQVVLVEVDNVKDLAKAYPSYHADLHVFMRELVLALT